MKQTGANMGMLGYKLHNFGDRGADSPDEAPVIAGIAHAAIFSGSDCTRANGYIKKLFRTKKAYTSSVEATEHTTMCMNSDAANKDDFGAAVMAVERLEEVVARTKRGIGIPLMSVVIDTYNSRRFVREYMGTRLKDRILASGGVMVMRPDSGDPTVEPSMVAKDVEATFGATVNAAGYKVLNPSTSVIQGDGLRVDTIESIILGWVNAGYSMDSFVMGMGGGITHFGSRDDFSFSMKTVACMDANGVWRRLLKDPVTDAGKRSLSGLVRCIEVDGQLKVVDMTDSPAEYFQESAGWKQWVKNGDRVNFQDFDEVKERASA
jgi:nicotinamide phosphoribosyltransferase